MSNFPPSCTNPFSISFGCEHLCLCFCTSLSPYYASENAAYKKQRQLCLGSSSRQGCFVYFFSLIWIFAFDEGEHITNLVLGVLCLTGRKTRDFLFNGSVGGSVVDANLAPPKIFAGAVRSARNWYGLRTRP